MSLIPLNMLSRCMVCSFLYSVIIPCLDPIFDVPLLPHPVGAPVVPAVHFSMHPYVASISQLSSFPLPCEVGSLQVVIEEEQHID